ncbi:hypothetical protein TWF569_009711 [Orbilia oligospora]|uniref:Uncharacterized protein n=1 Tax=Orbilia oligospora TaxID=2813651 RepID=A0A7C8JA55_ORBOL|nr:hypothetical protein TWF102_009530 [Orbilia oligospora]KAF3093507.1 hypothetical protein TWF706_008745 [Orbilia oligospora]KAF3102463.1 hypothetical protein TWF103_007637 [Orbilia oligospora]KAF3141131.1 hypothetical protein TWF594_006165 [Orbilia oligospora]KAF3155177.1 hypothetical protein TWF569_009711 [Orbilia oligospora]
MGACGVSDSGMTGAPFGIAVRPHQFETAKLGFLIVGAPLRSLSSLHKDDPKGGLLLLASIPAVRSTRLVRSKAQANFLHAQGFWSWQTVSWMDKSRGNNKRQK